LPRLGNGKDLRILKRDQGKEKAYGMDDEMSNSCCQQA